MARKRKGRDISGWVVIDKPAGPTSTTVVNKVRWAFDAKKAGHAGTLDPDATGVLAIALGEDFIHAPFEHEASAIHDGNSVTDLFDLSKEMRAKYDGLTFRTHGVNHPADGRRADGVDAGGGFVEDDEFGVMDNRLR